MNSLLRHFWDGLTNREKVGDRPPEPPPERRHSPRRPESAGVKLRWALVDGDWRTVDATVRDVSQEGFKVEAQEAPEAGQAIWIQREQSPAIRASVRRVESTEGDWMVALEVIRREKRRFERHPADGRAKARWLGVTGAPESCCGKVINLSDAGMQVEVEQAPPPGAYVRIIGRHVECAGSLRYCNAIQDGGPYLIGLQFMERRLSPGPSSMRIA